MKQFRLAKDPTAVQISIHMNNMIRYYHPDNHSGRHPLDKKFFATDMQLIAAMRYLLTDTSYIAIQNKKDNPIGFRLAQLIIHYGPKSVENYLKAVYSEAA
jgi:hypothetical protein